MRAVPGNFFIVTSDERRWVLRTALLILALTSLPYLVGYASQGAEWRFTGFVFGVEDGNSYIAKMLRGSAGDWLFETPYTSQPQSGVVAFLPYLLLGKLAAPPALHEQLVVLYHLFRIGAGVLCLLATYDFIALFCRRIIYRRFGMLLTALGGGLGWILVLFGKSQWLDSLPLEFYSPETFGFLSLYGIPHLALARAALLWALTVYLRCSMDEAVDLRHSSLLLGVLWLMVALAQPISAVVLGIIIGLHSVVSLLWLSRRERTMQTQEMPIWKRSIRLGMTALIVPVPFLLYNLVSFARDPFLRAWTAQNIIRSPHPAHYLMAYGLVLPCAALGAVYLYRRVATWLALYLPVWVCSLPFLAYAPFNLQRRLPEGIWVALVGLCMVALESWKPPTQVQQLKSALIGVFILAFPSTILLWVGGFLTALRPVEPVFRPADEVEVFMFLGKVARSQETVLAPYSTSNALPAWAPVRVVVGHGPESVDAAQLKPQIEAFFELKMAEADMVAFLKEHGVRYVIWNEEEAEAQGLRSDGSGIFSLLHRAGSYALYQVTTQIYP